jgi:hypothetical protein
MWLESNRSDYSVWGEYRSLAEAERLYLPAGTVPSAERFAEFHTALLLEREGFVCWGGVQLFQYGKSQVAGQENTETVRALWKKTMNRPWPNDVKATLELPQKGRPRNPDIVAYREARKEWRFCEVKRKDSVDPCQVIALAILHLLTGAPVAIVRLASSGRQESGDTWHPAEISYRAAGRPDWIRQAVPEAHM